ncbi:MAG TPA: hypothetical protein VIG33_07590 [Pseudobdellovibrionaceae bacterium]|jgi:hypothetical protein
MDFKKTLVIFGAIYCAVMAGCGVNSLSDKTSDNIIGNPTQSVTTLSTPDEGESQNLVIFDKTVRRIHQFDLTSMKHVRSFAVRNPEEEHFVLYGQNGNYIVDLSFKGLGIFDRSNQVNHQPIKFQGVPKSAAFLPSKGLLIVYDDLMSVGMLKLDINGEVLGSWVGGASIVGTNSIAAGDLNEEGKLILALSDGSVIVVDPEQSMTKKSWMIESVFNTELSNIKWVAPLPKTPNQILIRSSSKLSLLELNSKTIISSYDIFDEVVKLSKFNDPHIVMNNGNEVKVAYVEKSQIKVKTFYLHKMKSFEMNYLMSSNLDLVKDTWSFVDTKEVVNYFFNDLDQSKKDRRFVRYRFSDALAIHNMPVANDTQVEIADSFIFALFPRELGYAVRYEVETGNASPLERFNLKYIPVD